MYKINHQIPVDYFVLRERYLRSVIDRMPLIKSGFRGEKEVIRIYSSDKTHYREIARSNKDWDEYRKVLSKREKLQKMLSNVKAALKVYSSKASQPAPEPVNLKNRYGISYYDKLVDESCPYKNDTDYFYDGRHYRSRSEMMIAEWLTELGLEFKHDVLIQVGDSFFTIDFIIIFREFNRCIFTEFFGKSYDPAYNHDNACKLEALTNEGIYLGRDLFIFSGDIKYTPGSDVIKSQLLSIIEQLVCYHVRRE